MKIRNQMPESTTNDQTSGPSTAEKLRQYCFPFRPLVLNPVERADQQPENPFTSLIPDQKIAIVPSFDLESGVRLHNVPIAYSTRGKLTPDGDNAMVICHALTGSADVSDWWGPLMGGSGRAFDISRFFVVCLNSLGSPYGSASPVTYKNGDQKQGRYGPEFPLTTVRDDVKYVHIKDPMVELADST